MSLTGNLEVFPLEEVLRLLARSRRDGCLRVTAEGTEGKVFLAGGSLVFATTEPDEAFRRSLAVAGVVADDRIGTLDAGHATVVEAAGEDRAGLAHDFVRESIVESLYRLRKPARGSFDFVLEARPRYATGITYDVEVAVTEADRRAAEWADIESTIPDLRAAFTMAPRLTEDQEVTITPATWKLLAAFGGAGSISELADRLGSTEFRVAKEVAGLTRQGLIQASQPEPAAEVQAFAPEPEPEETTVEETGYRGGWWHEATTPVDVPSTPAGAVEPGEEVEAEAADSVLEQVFSEIEETGDEQEGEGDDGFGIGLLRRRRMGAITRDIVDGDA